MSVIPHNKLSISTEESLAAQSVLESGILANGEQVSLFEYEICEFLGLPDGHAVATSTGSTALFLALKALNSGHVVMPTYVCNSLKQAADLAGLTTEIIDTTAGKTIICQKSLNNSNADTLIYPYLYGQATTLPSFSGKIIEDVAQALGASANGKPLGAIADIGVLSFYATKLITSGGQGGMVVSKNKEHIDFIRDYLDFDMRSGKSHHFNLPLSELQAAIGRCQLKKLPSFIQKREQIWQIYKEAKLPLLDDTESNCQSVRYRAIVTTNKANQLIAKLKESNISAIIPIEVTELLKISQNAQSLANNTVSLPIYPTLSLEHASKIATICHEFLK